MAAAAQQNSTAVSKKANKAKDRLLENQATSVFQSTLDTDEEITLKRRTNKEMKIHFILVIVGESAFRAHLT